MTELLATALMPVGFQLLRWIFPGRAKRHRKKLLKKLLKDGRFPQGRSLKELKRKTGTTATECRTLLSEIGAEGITLCDGREGSRLSTLGDDE